MMGLNLSRRLISGKTSSVSLSAATPFTLEGGFKGKCDTFSVVRCIPISCVLTDLLLGQLSHGSRIPNIFWVTCDDIWTRPLRLQKAY